MYVLGVDIGSLASKGLVLSGSGEVVSYVITHSRPKSKLSASDVLELTLKKTGLNFDDIDYIVATGYGRVSVPYANEKVTEILCHARGANWINPEIRTIIDIGGQDSKVISVNKTGRVLNFVMNDRCAAGTGRFLEVMSGALEVELNQFGDMALTAKTYPKISNVCTVFAESEIISLMAEGKPRAEIALGLCNSVVSRIYNMLLRLKVEERIAMSGGGSKNRGIVEVMEKYLGLKVFVPDDPQSTGALGAALIARERATMGV